MPEYQRLRLRLPTELEEEIAADLWAGGSLGLELRTCGAATLVDAYFDASAGRLKALLESISTRGAEVLAREALPDTD